MHLILNLKAKIISPNVLTEFQRIVVAFVDNAYFYGNRAKFKENMEKIMSAHAELCKAKGGKIQQDKIFSIASNRCVKMGNMLLFKLK